MTRVQFYTELCIGYVYIYMQLSKKLFCKLCFAAFKCLLHENWMSKEGLYLYQVMQNKMTAKAHMSNVGLYSWDKQPSL